MGQQEILRFFVNEYDTNKDAHFTVTEVYNSGMIDANISSVRRNIRQLFAMGYLQLDVNYLKDLVKGQRTIPSYRLMAEKIRTARAFARPLYK